MSWRWFPVFQRVFHGLIHRTHPRAGGEQFRRVENAVRARSLDALLIKLRVAREKFKRPGGFQDSLNFLHNLPGRNRARIGHVVNAEWRLSFPKVKTGADEVTTMRER